MNITKTIEQGSVTTTIEVNDMNLGIHDSRGVQKLKDLFFEIENEIRPDSGSDETEDSKHE